MSADTSVADLRAAIQDLIKRLYKVGTEFPSLRCFMIHGIEMTAGDASQEVGDVIPGYSNNIPLFKPVYNCEDQWGIAYYFHDGLNVHFELITELLNQLFRDALIFKKNHALDFSVVPGLEAKGKVLLPTEIAAREVRFGDKILEEGTWLWLVFHAAWAAPLDSPLRAERSHPPTVDGIEPLRSTVNGMRQLQPAEHKAIWRSALSKTPTKPRDLYEEEEYLSELPINPFTASAIVLEMAVANQDQVTECCLETMDQEVLDIAAEAATCDEYDSVHGAIARDYERGLIRRRKLSDSNGSARDNTQTTDPVTDESEGQKELTAIDQLEAEPIGIDSAGPFADSPPTTNSTEGPVIETGKAPTADLDDYITATQIRTEHTPDGVVLDHRKLNKFLDLQSDTIRTTRPLGKNGKPRTNRLLVHLGDWHKNTDALIEWCDADSNPIDRQSKEQIEARKEAVRIRK